MEDVSKPLSPSAAECQDDQELMPDQNPKTLGDDQDQKCWLVNPDEDDISDKVLEDHNPHLDYEPEVQTEDRFPTQTYEEDLSGQSEFSPVAEEKIQDCMDKASGEYQNRSGPDLTSAPTNQGEAGESGGCVPALVVTEADQARRSAAVPQRAARPPDLVIPAAISVSNLISSGDGGDANLCDLLSPRSDSCSVTSEVTISRRSEEDDTRSVTASSVMSLFHRVQLDPLEKDWLRSSAVGNMAAQRLLLAQDPGLVLKKDFVTTALHWAAKQGRQEAVDMMIHSGADVNVRSVRVCEQGYTALHVASIHGHQEVVQTLISTYNAKTNIRDYHGKTAVQYWSGSTDIFSTADPHTSRMFCPGRRTQRFALPSLHLSRSRSQGQLHLEFGAVHQSASYEALDLHV
ncbi:ankyrin repeat domain-containing protein SOWAHC isoform X3 [Poecilia latipinna]|uniref:ankyrin repeat domain-containing protein SOWAHC isoform X3 n=1 Tax=Poecilia latipinna TaxID=48699 RepID=UPI00072E605A|nr:PREDICTED: ankyrin repeat domain-containing protein SOWAHC-like isoform X3 [Poecilia latipinna]